MHARENGEYFKYVLREQFTRGNKEHAPSSPVRITALLSTSPCRLRGKLWHAHTRRVCSVRTPLSLAVCNLLTTHLLCIATLFAATPCSAFLYIACSSSSAHLSLLNLFQSGNNVSNAFPAYISNSEFNLSFSFSLFLQ